MDCIEHSWKWDISRKGFREICEDCGVEKIKHFQREHRLSSKGTLPKGFGEYTRTTLKQKHELHFGLKMLMILGFIKVKEIDA